MRSRMDLAGTKTASLVFIIFLLANSFLSYAPLGLGTKVLLGVVGLVLPGLWFWRKSRDPKPTGTPLDQKEFLPSIPFGAWLLLALAAVAARFTWLQGLMVWPNFDESSYGFDAIQMVRGEPPRLFYGVSQAPPLYVWGLGLFFKLFGASLTTMHLFPAILSLAAVPLAYGAARTWFSRSFSFLCALLVAAGFWPVFLGRFSLMTILILPMELLALWMLGNFFRSKDEGSRARAAWGLGLVWGFGLYSHLHWPVVVAMTALPLGIWFLKKFRKEPGRALGLATRATGAALLTALPLLFGALHQHYGGYLVHLWAFHRDFSWTRQLGVWASCLTSPFWGMDTSVHTYQPEWGGFLNPVLASLFFIGILAPGKDRPFRLFLGGAYLLGLMPGLLTQDMETFRLFPLVPILVVGTLLGLTRLLEGGRPAGNLFVVLVLLLPSVALDSIHLFYSYHRLWNNPAIWGNYTKSIGRYRAFGILEEKRKKEGPGFIFPDFVQGLPDQSLTVATFDDNVVLNPRLAPSGANWAAILTNVNYKPFLDARFPKATAHALTEDFSEPDGGWMLYVFPLDEGSRRTMDRWARAQGALEGFIDRDLCYVMGRSFTPDLKALDEVESSFRGDPFLRAAFWEKRSDLQVKQRLGGIAEEDNAIPSLEKAIAEGYPAAHLYEHLGVQWLMAQKPAEAEKAFQKALRAPLNLTDAAQYRQALARPAPSPITH